MSKPRSRQCQKNASSVSKAWRESRTAEQKKVINARRAQKRREQKAREHSEEAERTKALEEKNKISANQQAAQRMRKSRAKKSKLSSQNLVLPSTPNSKAKFIADLVESTTPTTSAKLAEKNLQKSSIRTAERKILDAAAVAIRKPIIRRDLIQILNTTANTNKNAISKILQTPRSGFYYKSSKGSCPRTAVSTVQVVTQFYLCETVTTTYPNKTKNGKILKVLKFSRKQTFKLFRSQHPEISISKTTFDKLKPSEVKLMKHSKWMQCLCEVCENVKNLSQAVKTSMEHHSMAAPSFLGAGNELDLARHTVCDSLKSLECLNRKCETCSVAMLNPIFNDWIVDDTHQPVNFFLWEYVSEDINGKSIKKLRKVQHSEPRWNTFKLLKEHLEKFPYHMYNNISQLSAFKKCKAGLASYQAVAIVDFAENYVCREAEEAQSSFYGRNSVTVHPMVLIFCETNTIKRDSVVVISNDLHHDGHAVKAYIKCLGNHIEEKYPQISELIIWSDGCSCQYKSRVPVYNIAQSFDTSMNIRWNFFGSRHGKGESDGESAVVKNYLDVAIRAQRLTVTSPKEAYDVLRASPLQIDIGPSQRHIYYIPHTIADIYRHDFQNLVITPLAGIRSVHQIRANGLGLLEHRKSSCYCQNPDVCKHDSAAIKWQRFTPGN